MTVRDLEPYLGHPEDPHVRTRAPRGNPLFIPPWKIVVQHGNRGKGEKVCQKQKARQPPPRDVGHGRSKIEDLGPKRKTRAPRRRTGENRERRHNSSTFSSLEGVEEQEIVRGVTAAGEVETGGRSRHGAEIQKKEGKCPHAAMLLRGTLPGKSAKRNM